MKRLFLFLFALPLLLLASCSDDDKAFPDFKVKIDITGQSEVTDDGVIVVPAGSMFSVDAISLMSSDAKEITIGGASYYWNYSFKDSNIISPYGMSFITEGLPEGDYMLQIYMSVFAVGYSPAEALLSYHVRIVAPAGDTDDSMESTASYTITATPKVVEK